MLKQSVIKSIVEKTGKGGTYFGATGCCKTYTMAFLARQLALRCTKIAQIGSPTVVLIVDRDDLQNQGSKLFTKSKEFLNLGDVSIVKNRENLRQELGARQSGGFYICTIQKFCDSNNDKIGLINERQNIVCFSDEAHRTQIEKARQIKLEGEKAEFVFASTSVLKTETKKGSKDVSFKTYFLKTVKRMRAAFDICMPCGVLEEKETALAQCFMAIAGIIRKMSGTGTDIDTDLMNRYVSKMVEEALKYSKVESVLENGTEENLTAEYFDTLVDVNLPATKLELLIKLLKKKIADYGKTNKIEAKKFQELLQKTIDEYHDRKKGFKRTRSRAGSTASY